LEFNASVGIIHKESVTMHGRTILKYRQLLLLYHYNPSLTSFGKQVASQKL